MFEGILARPSTQREPLVEDLAVNDCNDNELKVLFTPSFVGLQEETDEISSRDFHTLPQLHRKPHSLQPTNSQFNPKTQLYFHGYPFLFSRINRRADQKGSVKELNQDTEVAARTELYPLRISIHFFPVYIQKDGRQRNNS